MNDPVDRKTGHVTKRIPRKASFGVWLNKSNGTNNNLLLLKSTDDKR